VTNEIDRLEAVLEKRKGKKTKARGGADGEL
jgi:hypothetical protein